jgi:hypothetical protein
MRGIEAVRPGIAERTDHVEVLGDRTRPAVAEYQRQRLGFRGADMQEVHGGAVDRGQILRVRIELRLPGAPVVPITPVLDQFPDPGDGDAVPVGATARLGGPPDPDQSVAQLGKITVGDLDAKRSDG